MYFLFTFCLFSEFSLSHIVFLPSADEQFPYLAADIIISGIEKCHLHWVLWEKKSVILTDFHDKYYIPNLKISDWKPE